MLGCQETNQNSIGGYTKVPKAARAAVGLARGLLRTDGTNRNDQGDGHF